MNPAHRRLGCPLLLSAFAVLGLACNETKTPTEPSLVGATPIPATTLSGIVRDQATGAPYAPAAVFCEVTSTEVSINPPGSYRLTGLKPGVSVVKVYAQGQNQAQSFDVTLAPGDNVKDFAINVVKGEPASMSGFVRLPSGAPAPPHTAVYCQMKVASVAADGSYSLAGLYAGRWDVNLIWNDWDGESYETVTLAPGPNRIDFTAR